MKCDSQDFCHDAPSCPLPAFARPADRRTTLSGARPSARDSRHCRWLGRGFGFCVVRPRASRRAASHAGARETLRPAPATLRRGLGAGRARSAISGGGRGARCVGPAARRAGCRALSGAGRRGAGDMGATARLRSDRQPPSGAGGGALWRAGDRAARRCAPARQRRPDTLADRACPFGGFARTGARLSRAGRHAAAPARRRFGATVGLATPRMGRSFP